jgi:hypothetical protein
MIQLQGQYELSDFKKAQSLHARGGKLSTWVGYAVIGMIAVITLTGIVLALLGRFPWEFVTLPILLLAVWAFFQFVLIPYQLGRVFKQQKDLSAPFEIELTDEEFHFWNEFGSSRIPWGDFVKWKENAELLLLYRSDAAFHLLPKRLFPSGQAADYVMSHLRAHNVPNTAKVRNPVQVVFVAGLIVVAIVVFFLNFNSR